jgi:purine-nucleoside phosphorylase
MTWLAGLEPRIAVVLGSGLGRIADRLEGIRRLSYSQVEGFPASEVAGHRGELIAGRLRGVPILCQSGRFHPYEGHSAPTVARPVRLFAALGIDTLVVTNAAGGIAARLDPGSLMLITDQINLTFRNPLHGPVAEGDSRFPDMSAPYDPLLAGLARASARRLGIRLEEGIYAGVLGPSYETPAEIRMLRTLGADAVGMSTVMEVIAARAAGMRCLGCAVVTNRASGLGAGALSHQEVLERAERAGEDLARLLEEIVAQVDVVPGAVTL